MENLEKNIPENEDKNLLHQEQPVVEEFESAATVEEVNETQQAQQEVTEVEAAIAPESVATKKKNSKKVWIGVLCGVLAVCLFVGGGVLAAQLLEERWEDRFEQQREEFEDLLDSVGSSRNPLNDSSDKENGKPVESVSGSKTPAQVYADNVDTVVMVYCKYKSQQGSQVAAAYSTGSGFIVTENGYVVTNAHVVDGADSISVTIYDGTQYSAKLIGTDSVNDVALLKMDATGLDYAVIGKSDDLIVGDQVVAIGNPLGELTSTLTVGYISAKERNVTTEGSVINMLQTDAAINSGNSGGPLFNMNGEVVGITTAKYSGTSQSGASIEGIGFAIPIDDVLDLLADLKQYGYVTGAYLGVSVKDMDPDQASYFSIPVGAYVVETVEGFCAAAAGVQEKDIIVALGEYEVSTVSDLTKALRNFSAGDDTNITVFRGGQKLVLDITLDERPADNSASTLPELPSDRPEGDFDQWYEYFAPYFDWD